MCQNRHNLPTFTVAYEAVVIADGSKPQSVLCWSVRILMCYQSIRSFVFLSHESFPVQSSGLGW